MPRLDEIKARCDAATEGPWGVEIDGGILLGKAYRIVAGEKTIIHEGRWQDGISYGDMTHENATFIAHAREDIPWLIAEVERLSALCADIDHESALRQESDGEDWVRAYETIDRIYRMACADIWDGNNFALVVRAQAQAYLDDEEERAIGDWPQPTSSQDMADGPQDAQEQKEVHEEGP
jgi:hypothetical protein